MRVVLVTAILGLVAACAGGGTTSDPTPATTPPVACTEIGCNSGLQVDLATVDLVADAAYLVELCIGSDCVEVEQDLVTPARSRREPTPARWKGGP